ncbi:MAG: tyrosine-type recombinase/integrase [Planctomycetota bacterium]|nr:tyrosine-type recombinase/integrase [Planctomycetota bacterium]
MSKNRQPREVPLTSAAHAALSSLRLPSSGSRDPVWPDLLAITAPGVSARFRRLARRAGFDSLRAHDLRHGFCSRMAQAGVPLPTVGLLAGHRSIATTQRYAGHVPDGATAAAIRRLEMAERVPDMRLEGDQQGDQAEVARATA